MTLNEYQLRCADTAKYPGCGTRSPDAITYTILGLAGETGEVADKWKKFLRGDHGPVLPPEVRALIVKELGDVLWYAARVATELGVPLSDVAQGNLDKLADRNERGVIKGSGDLRQAYLCDPWRR
jgi:NTP pyrophosphatase (non-canonical NTP hydrolase)